MAVAWGGTKNQQTGVRGFRTKRDDIMMSGCWPPKNASCYLPCWLPQQCFGTKDVMKPASLSTYMEQLKCQENADAKHQHWTLCKGFKDYISPFALPTYEISCVIMGSMCIVLLGSSKIEKLVTFFVGAPFESSRHRPELGQLCGDSGSCHGWSGWTEPIL